jgi:hypothetical protein
MHSAVISLWPFLLVGCATHTPIAHTPAQSVPVTAVTPAQAMEVRYDVRGYRDPANPALRHEAHAVHRRTLVPATVASADTVSRTSFPPSSHAPLPASAELAAELSTQRAITAELRTMHHAVAETERQMQSQYAHLVRQSEEVAKLRTQLEAERARMQTIGPRAATESVKPSQVTEAKW